MRKRTIAGLGVGAVALGAVGLAVLNHKEAPAPQQPEATAPASPPAPQLDTRPRFTVLRDTTVFKGANDTTPLADIVLKANSCVIGAVTSDGKDAAPVNDRFQITATYHSNPNRALGDELSGYANRNDIQWMGNSQGNACTAVFMTQAQATTPAPATNPTPIPTGFYVSSDTLRFSATPGGPQVGRAVGKGNCVKVVDGGAGSDFAKVNVPDGVTGQTRENLYTLKATLTPDRYYLDDKTCWSKFTPGNQ